MKQKIIVLSVNPYKMDMNGQHSEGISVRYLTTDNMDSVVNEDKSLGTRPAKANLPYSWSDLFIAAPAIYEADMTLKVGSDGKPVMNISHIDYVSQVKLTVNAVEKAATK